MITDIKNVSISIQDRVITNLTNIEGNLSDWYHNNGSYQVAFMNNNFESIIKIPNRNHGDSAKLLDCSGVDTWGRPDDQARPINKYKPNEIKSLYALLQFHYDKGFGPKMGRIFDITINGETYIAFEQERLSGIPYVNHIAKENNLEVTDYAKINTAIYNEMMKPNGFIEMYRPYDALKNEHNNHVISTKSDSRIIDIDYKGDCSIFFMDGDNTLCFDVDYNTIRAYFNTPFIDKITQEYSDLIDERNFSDYL